MRASVKASKKGRRMHEREDFVSTESARVDGVKVKDELKGYRDVR